MQLTDHLLILAQYRPTQMGEGWPTAPDDGYLYDKLAYHLREAGLIDELRKLFTNHNWLHARLQHGSYDRFMADLAIAWKVSYQEAITQIKTGRELTAFLECIHLALVETSLRSWAESRTPSVVARAIEVGLWSSAKAMSVAELIPDEQRRARMYAVLAKSEKLTSAQASDAKTEALTAAKNIQHAWSRASTLSMLSKQTEADQQHDAFVAVLDAALESADGPYGQGNRVLTGQDFK